jgi:CBS domain-containing protein
LPGFFLAGRHLNSWEKLLGGRLRQTLALVCGADFPAGFRVFPKPGGYSNIQTVHPGLGENGMQVREIVRIKGQALFTATAQQSLAVAIDTMAENDVGSLVVMAEGKMVGMLTFREILQAVKKHGGDLSRVTVGDVMVANPVTAYPDMEVNDLRHLMIDKHSRYLPVMDGNTLMGVISFLDVAKAVLEEQSFENKMLKSYIKNWPDGSSQS